MSQQSSTGSGAIINVNFNLGGSAAEYDPLLLEAYIDNGAYDAVELRSNPRSFLIGRTGSGKSAALRLLTHNKGEKVITIAPENLAMTYITNLDILPRLLELGVQLEPFLKALWKHVFIVEILRHRYHLTTPEQKYNLMVNLRNRFRKDPGKLAAIDYLSDFGDRFWCETDERVKQIATTFEQKFKAVGEAGGLIGSVGIKGSAGSEHAERSEQQTELVNRYQRIVNEVQIPRISTMMELMNTEILDEQHFTYIVIDDLDKDWVDDKFVNLLIRCLFQAVMDMRRITHLKILVALRTNIFHQLNFAATRKGEQEEKVRDFILDMQWREADLRNLLARRAEVASQSLRIDPPLTLDRILPSTSKKAPNPLEYILSRTLMRPRDAILFLNECLKTARGHASIAMDDVYEAEKQYSNERLIALRDEWKDPYLGIERVFEKFHGFPRRFPRASLTVALSEAALLVAEPGYDWLETLCEPIWAPGSELRSWTQNYGSLTRLLYTIGFIGIARIPTTTDSTKGKDTKAFEVTYSYEEPNLLSKMEHIMETILFEIHPAFQQALGITGKEMLYP